MPGTMAIEKKLHKFFRPHADSGFPSSTSHYSGDRIWSYVTWLIANGFASMSREDVPNLPLPTWSAVNPSRVAEAWEDEGRQLTLVRPTRMQRIRKASATGYHSSMSDEWYTPAEIVESARRVLGHIDLDPASCPKANRTVKAAAFFSQRVDGLDQPWEGRVWLNPPYGNMAKLFVEKLLHSLDHGVTEAILLLNQNSMSSLWFDPIYSRCSALAITRGRLDFTPADESQTGSSTSTGHVLVYFGPRPGVFLGEFRSHGNGLLPESACR